MNNEKIETIVQALDHIRKRPGMYFTQGIAPVENFLAGFNLAAHIFLEQSNSGAKSNDVWRENGLHPNQSIYKQLKDQGLEDMEAIEKYLSLMIEDYQSWSTPEKIE